MKAPAVLGARTVEADLRELLPYIDWTPFFQVWQLYGKYPCRNYPRIFEDARVGEEAAKLFRDAEAMLERIIADKSLQARGVFGLFPANSEGDDILCYADESRAAETARFFGLRQQAETASDEPCLCLSDFVAPVASGARDYVGCFAVSAGFGCAELCEKFKKVRPPPSSSAP